MLEEIQTGQAVDNLNPQIRQYNEKVLATAMPGDMIEFPRDKYSHWGIYSGQRNENHYVIHKTGAAGQIASQPHHICTCSGQTYDKSIVREDNALIVAKNRKLKINNYRDHKKKPFPKQKIVQNARDKMELNDPSYSLMFKNCQHFATECRYGEPHSQQISTAVSVTAAVGAGLVLAGLIGAAAYAKSKMTKKDEEEEYEEA